MDSAPRENISLTTVQLFNWLLLLGMSGAGWLTVGWFVAKSIFIGGVLANISFALLKRDLLKLLGGPLEAAKALFFIKYYLRLTALVVVLFLLVRYQQVHTIGLLVGLSTVLLSIVVTMAGAVKKMYFRVEEAS